MIKKTFKFKKWLLMFTFLPAMAFASNLVSLNLKNAPVSEILLMLGEVSNQNIVIDPNIQAKMSVALHEVPWQKALNDIVVSNHLILEHSDGVYTVSTFRDADKNHEKEPNQLIKLPIFYGKASSVKDLILKDKILSKRSRITVDYKQNALILNAPKYDIQKVKLLLQKIDIPAPEVLIKARIVQVNSQALKALGVHFLKVAGGSSVSFDGSTQTKISHAIGALGLTVGELPAGLMLDMTLQALQTTGKGKVISAPHLLVTSGQSATIEQGSEIPYAVNNGSGAYSIQFKKAVMGLKVTPTVLQHQMIRLELNVTKDSVSKVILSSAKHEPIIHTQDIQTEVRLKNKSTIVLGGIIESNEHDNLQKVPFLGDIPGIGLLFRSHEKQLVKQEVLIFVTPEITSRTQR